MAAPHPIGPSEKEGCFKTHFFTPFCGMAFKSFFVFPQPLFLPLPVVFFLFWFRLRGREKGDASLSKEDFISYGERGKSFASKQSLSPSEHSYSESSVPLFSLLNVSLFLTLFSHWMTFFNGNSMFCFFSFPQKNLSEFLLWYSAVPVGAKSTMSY